MKPGENDSQVKKGIISLSTWVREMQSLGKSSGSHTFKCKQEKGHLLDIVQP